ncbi:hypothetical protein GIB67_028733 [Kingdonia uniflora]|uniref:Uncharacterized protein n=1 Tax=Kingdonia uniflora TaxID=39325 RepID=A0A7J7N9U8_9MAGN|nr:hypothetical protein GIB67_028733 [Kingdonia uniflora]
MKRCREENIEKTVVRSYMHGFSGFAARLSENEASIIARQPGVVSVFEDPVLELHTTRSWDFLQYQTDTVGGSRRGRTESNSPSEGADSIIGILDTGGNLFMFYRYLCLFFKYFLANKSFLVKNMLGIWPESDSFDDKGMGPIPFRWKGVCMEGTNFHASDCNRKLIGARYYNHTSKGKQVHTPRDSIGHGTHTASTAAGSSVSGASYYGLATGTAKGGSPGSRIAMYRVCTPTCYGSNVLAAFDDAINDGVDVLSLSIGAPAYFRPDLSTDPVAIGSFHAVDRGIVVVCSGGNDGPMTETVVNAAPWLLTVAASTIDRDFESDVVLGDNTVVKGEAINFSNLGRWPIHPLIYAGTIKSNSASDNQVRNCYPGALDGDQVNGKIVVCEHSDNLYSKSEKMDNVKNLGGIGLILIDDLERGDASTYGRFPMTVVSSYDAITPDIAAPGVGILAAWIDTNDTSKASLGQNPSKFNVLSGTSMSCPHVSGIAAAIKSKYPTWGPAAVRSAIMTTVIQVNNFGSPITTDSSYTATPYDTGAGEVSPSDALQPGLVFETNTDDYLQFLCNYGYSIEQISLITNDFPKGFICPENSNEDLVSQLNYPSIAISGMTRNYTKKVSRTVKSIHKDDEDIYAVSIEAPRGLVVKVVPDKLHFTKMRNSLTYEVTFTANLTTLIRHDLFGTISWTNGKYYVRTPFVVSH